MTTSATASATAPTAPAFDKRQVENLLPLLPLQQGLLFHSLLAPDSGSYLPQAVLTLQGPLDAAALRQAWTTLLARHGALRSSFHWEQRDEPFQVVWRSAALPWVQHDWRALPATEQAGRLQAVLAAQRAQPFDLRRPPLMRLALLQLADERHQLVWCHHHLLLDGWSASLLLRELFMLLRGLPLPPAPRPFAEAVAWHQEQKRQGTPDAARAWWQQALRGLQPAPAWPLLGPAPRQGAAEPAHATQVLTPELSGQLRAFARQHGLTLASLLQGSVGLLHRRCGVHAEGRPDDIVFGHTVSGRPAELTGALQMLGLFINTVPLRQRLSPRQPLLEWLRDLQAAQAEAAPHEHVPLRTLQALAANGEMPHAEDQHAAPALFDTLLVIENYPAGGALPTDAGADHGPRLAQLQIEESTHYGLTLQVAEAQTAEGEQLTLAARWDGRRATSAVVQRLLQHWQQLLQQMLATPQAPLGRIGLLNPAELAQIEAWEDGGPALHQAGDSLATRFEAQARRTPEATALRFDGQSMRYEELDRAANHLAWRLRALGVDRESVVALLLPRSLALMVALLAVQKAGAAYLPLDADQPAARQAAMLQDARPAALLHASGHGLALPPLPPVLEAMPVLDLDAPVSPPASESRPPPRQDHPLQAAYLLYTSGSTGQPKGVLNHQAGIANRLRWMQQHLGLQPGDRVLQKTPLGFDVSVWELFWPLLEGATLVLAPPGAHRDREALAALIRAEQVSVLHFVPALLADFLQAGDLGTRAASLRHVVCSGEALSSALARQALQALPRAELHNLYGPTEAAVDVSAWRCRGEMTDDGAADKGALSTPIGRPIAGLRLRVLDADGLPVPPGVRGRLYIGGIGLARGYRGQPALTAERFAPDERGRLLYDSGDLARWREDGALDYLGRADAQIKLRGVRLEPGEVEAALVQVPGVRQALVRLWALDGGPQLVAYVVLDPAQYPIDASGADDPSDGVLTATLQRALRERLPEAMVPSRVLRLDALPLGPNGKPERRALPAPQQRRAAHVAPRSPVQQALAAIWQETLRLPATPGLDDSFFALGGHSLVAMRIVSRVQQRLGVALPLAAVFEQPTLRALADEVQHLGAAAAPATASTPAPAPAPASAPTPADYKEVDL